MFKSELVSVVVLTHNSKNFVKSCIDSIFNQEYVNVELILVDNFSTDGTKQFLADLKTDKIRSMKILLNSSNLGYNLGNLEGIKNSNGKYVVIVNPDVILKKSWITNMIKFLDKNSKSVLVGGVLQNENNSIQSTGGLMDIYGATHQRKSSEKDFFYSPGAACIFRKSILSKINFDPNLFMYYDDVDISWQLRLLGYKIDFCPDAIAYHKQEFYDVLSPSKFFHIAKNRIYVCSKNYSVNRLFRRVFKIIFLVGLDSIYYSYKFKSIRYFWTGLNAILWNFSIISNMNKERNKIQKNRIVSDDYIEKLMLKKSIEFNILKNQNF